MLTEQMSGLGIFGVSENKKTLWVKRTRDSSFAQIFVIFLENGIRGKIDSDTKIQTIFFRDISLARAKTKENLGPLMHDIMMLTTDNGWNKAPEIVRRIQLQYPRYILSNQITVGLDDLFQMLFKVAQIKESVFQNVFGVPAPKKSIDDQFQLVDGCLKIFIPSSVSNRDIYILPLQHAHKALQAKKLGYLIENIPIKVRNMKNKTLGWYDTQTGELSINQNYEKFDPIKMMETIIHEFGHRLEYEYFNKQQKMSVSATYKALLKGSRKDWAQDDLKTVTRLQSARQLFYKGKNLTFLSNNPYKYLKHDRKNVTIYSINKPSFVLSAAADKFSNIYVDNDPTPVVSSAGRQLDMDVWVTSYAMKDEHEFFCESFCFWVSGKLAPINTNKKKLIEWLEEIVKPSQR